MCSHVQLCFLCLALLAARAGQCCETGSRALPRARVPPHSEAEPRGVSADARGAGSAGAFGQALQTQGAGGAGGGGTAHADTSGDVAGGSRPQQKLYRSKGGVEGYKRGKERAEQRSHPQRCGNCWQVGHKRRACPGLSREQPPAPFPVGTPEKRASGDACQTDGTDASLHSRGGGKRSKLGAGHEGRRKRQKTRICVVVDVEVAPHHHRRAGATGETDDTHACGDADATDGNSDALRRDLIKAANEARVLARLFRDISVTVKAGSIAGVGRPPGGGAAAVAVAPGAVGDANTADGGMGGRCEGAGETRGRGGRSRAVTYALSVTHREQVGREEWNEAAAAAAAGGEEAARPKAAGDVMTKLWVRASVVCR